MKLKRTGLVRVGAWILTGLLAADIGLQLGGVEIGSKWEWREMGRRFSERLLKGAVNQANLAAFYYDGKQKKYRVAEYMPSPEDLEAVAEENTAVLLEDMAGENSEAVRKAQEDSERAETESEAGTEYVETLVGVPTGEIYSEKALMDYDFLLGHFYTVDPTTLANSKLINGTDLLQKDLTIDLDGAEPKILIYHTHSQEGYADSEAGNADDTVVGVGEQLKKVLEEKYHVAVCHDLSVYDMQDGKEDRNKAYSQAAVAVQNLLDEHPSIEVTVDLHRDGVPDNVHLETEINGKKTAKIMFLNGLCRNSNGDVNDFAQNPNLSDNLAFSLQLQLKAKAYFPELVRHIYLRAYRYNLHFKPRSLLVEVGAQNNTVAEAKNAMEPLADILYAVLSGK
ncbi:MAG: stage II sporulation protein P [Coprococcus catus]|jgi:stage II sporulation protein P|uniref:Stage II sporulation protein P n=1 Tax=Coprococcus intestinihominis TaxID=3133154 RepID=A0ABV1B6D5_9FIRM|nr:stage II sporulation protein P [Coprococcus catus]MDD6342738.1 stage II sporulation protein P [Coprococcus catus]